MLDTALRVLRISRSVKSGALSYIALDVSPRKDSEAFGSIWHRQDGDLSYFERIISKNEQMLLWRLHPYHFSGADAIFSGFGFLESFTYMVLCAVSDRGKPTEVRFKFADAEKRTMGPVRNEVYAVNLKSKEVFELRGSHEKYWHTPEKALITLFTQSDWWRPWSDYDSEFAHAALQASLTRDQQT